MNDTLVTVVAIFLAVALLIVVPLQVTSQRADTMSQLDVDELTSQFVDQIRSEGAITQSNYYNFKQSLASTGNTYDVNMEFKILDENPGKKTTQAERDKIGENVYYSVYTSQIEEAMENSETKKYSLHEGDFVSVTVKNTNLTIGQQIKNFAYKITGNDTYTISASKSGLVLANGSTSTVIANNVDKPEIEVVLRENDANGKVITKQNSNSTEVTNNWTNKNVYVELSSKENYNLDLIYFSRTKINSQDYYNYTKLAGNNFTETRAGENVYQVFWKASLLEKYSDIKDVRVRIDRTEPVINQIIASDEKLNTGKVTVVATDEGGSGIGGYFYKWSSENETPSQPDINDSGWVSSSSTIAYPENNNQKCTVWVKDNAGNISKSASGIVRNVVYPITGVTLNGAIMKTGETQTIKATLAGGTEYKDIKFEISDTSIATINGDGTEAKVTGQKPGKTTVKCTVTNYNGTTQTANAIITVTNVEFSPNGGIYKISYVDTTNRATLQSNVTVDGNPTKTEYSWSNSNTQEPNNWTQFNSGDDIKNIVSNVGNYYLWIRVTDEYNNYVLYVSNLFYVKYDVPNAKDYINVAYSTTNWTNQNVVVALSLKNNLSKEFGIQISSDGKNWSNANQYTFTANGTIYARIYDKNTNDTGSYMNISVNNIDKVAPVMRANIYCSSQTATSITVKLKAIDVNSGYSKVIWYYKKSNENRYNSVTDTEVATNLNKTGNTREKELTKTFSNLSTATTYNIIADFYDVAGNNVRTSCNVVTSKSNGSVAISASSGSTCIGKSIQFSVTRNTSGGSLSVSSSNNSVATAYVSNNAIIVTPKGKGTANIIVTSAATATYNSASATFTATITDHSATTGGSLVSNATCTSSAVYHYKCKICGKNLSSTYNSGSALGHSYSEANSELIGTWRWLEESSTRPGYRGQKDKIRLEDYSYWERATYAHFVYFAKVPHTMRAYIECGNPNNRVDICLGTARNATSGGTAYEAYPSGNWNLWAGRTIVSSGVNPSTYSSVGYTSYIEWGHGTGGAWDFTVSNISNYMGYPVYTYAQDCVRYYCSRCGHHEDRYITDSHRNKNWQN